MTTNSIFNSGRVRVYSLTDCPRCEELKEALYKNGILFDVVPMDSPEWITELRVNGCFLMEAPVLQVDESSFQSFEMAMGRLK